MSEIIKPQVFIQDEIFKEKGNIRKIISLESSGYNGFGEAYLSNIKKGETKGWKKHKKMTLNLFVIFGEVDFYIMKEFGITKNNYFHIKLNSIKNNRLTIPPNFWVAFRGLSKGSSTIINISDIKHDEEEVERIDYKKFEI